MDILNKRGVKVVLSTPTAAPPSWLIGKHPEILPLLKNGQRMEFGNPKCHCSNWKKEFQHWLRLKYKTLNNLNQSWGNAFWSHDYTTWEEIPLPIVDYHNPSFDLDFRRFFSDMNVEYSDMQIKLPKSIAPDEFLR